METRSLSELSAALERGETTSEALVTSLLDRIRAQDGSLNSFITLAADNALEEARSADARRARGEAGPLTGIPVAHKDIFCTEGVTTSCGSRMLADFVSPYDATVVARLRDAGMVMLGKTNMDEFAMGSSNENSIYGPVGNPWDTRRVPGGSSGGSAAAVAAGLTPAATGTDTGGSVRQPAALCGVTGLKPTYGRVSRWGMIAFASSLDQAGVFARSAEDVAMILQAIAGFDERDSTSAEEPVPDYRSRLDEDLSGLKVGLPREFFSEGLDAGVRRTVDEAVAALREAGAEPREVSVPSLELSVPAYYVIAPAECSSNLSRFDGVRFGYRCDQPRDLEDLYKRSRGEGFGAEVQRRILVGTYALSAGYYDAYYRKAQQCRRLIRDDFARALDEVDVLAGPTAPEVAFEIGAKADDPVKMYLSDINTIGANLAGLPAISVPAGFAEGLPVGLQLVGRHFDEARLLGVAARFQEFTDWHRYAPEGFS